MPHRLPKVAPPAALALSGLLLTGVGCQSVTPPSAPARAGATTGADTRSDAATGHAAVSQSPLRITWYPAPHAGPFRATLNGRDVTAAFVTAGGGFRFAGHRFPAAAAGHPQTFVFYAGPVEAERLTVRPGAVTARGNAGTDRAPRVRLDADEKTAFRVALPAAVEHPVTVTLTPDPQAGAAPVSIAGRDAGRPVPLTFPAGKRVATVNLYAVGTGRTTLELSAPGYAAAVLPVEVRPAPVSFTGVGADLRRPASARPDAGADTASVAADGPGAVPVAAVDLDD